LLNIGNHAHEVCACIVSACQAVIDVIIGYGVFALEKVRQILIEYLFLVDNAFALNVAVFAGKSDVNGDVPVLLLCFKWFC
jgi:hypothetical protein